MKLQAVRRDFDARRSATGKEYRYFIWNGSVLPPFIRHHRTHERRPLDTDGHGDAAAADLVGRHDFAAFAANPHQERGGTVRALWRPRRRRKGHEVTIVAGGRRVPLQDGPEPRRASSSGSAPASWILRGRPAHPRIRDPHGPRAHRPAPGAVPLEGLVRQASTRPQPLIPRRFITPCLDLKWALS